MDCEKIKDDETPLFVTRRKSIMSIASAAMHRTSFTLPQSRGSRTLLVILVILATCYAFLVASVTTAEAKRDFVVFMGHQQNHAMTDQHSNLALASRLPSWMGHIPGLNQPQDSGCGSPFDLPGRLVGPSKGAFQNIVDSHYSVYAPAPEDVEIDEIPVTSHSTSIRHTPHDAELKYLKDRSVLVIGDTIDRDAVQHLGKEVFGSKKTFISNTTTRQLLPFPQDQDHLVGHVVQKSLNFSVTHFSIMGVDVTDPVDWFGSSQNDPQRFENRYSNIFLPYLSKQVIPSPDVVIFNSGFWDLIFLARLQGQTEGEGNTEDVSSQLSSADLRFHRTRFSKFIRFLKKTFPNASLVYRSMHTSIVGVSPTDYVSKQRILDLDAVNRLTLTQFDGIRVMNWGDKVIGLEGEIQNPPLHFGRGAALWLYGDMLLEQVRHHVWGEQEWEGCNEYKNMLSKVRMQEKDHLGM